MISAATRIPEYRPAFGRRVPPARTALAGQWLTEMPARGVDAGTAAMRARILATRRLALLPTALPLGLLLAR